MLKVATGLYKYTTMWYCPGVFVILARAGKNAAAAFVANLLLSLVGLRDLTKHSMAMRAPLLHYNGAAYEGIHHLL